MKEVKCEKCGMVADISPLDPMCIGTCKKCKKQQGYRTDQNYYSCRKCGDQVDVKKRYGAAWCKECRHWTDFDANKLGEPI